MYMLNKESNSEEEALQLTHYQNNKFNSRKYYYPLKTNYRRRT